MYFSTVFVFLLTFEFIQMQPEPPPMEDMIPFSDVYADSIKNFLKIVIKESEIFSSEKLGIFAEVILLGQRHNDLRKFKI